MGYKLRLDIFEGPLDLLLYLIKKDDLDITKIAISEVTDQYLEYIDAMKMLDLDIVGDFLVMAATLMQIKSKTLLPPDPEEIKPVEEDPAEDLVKRLLEYKRFKEIAEQLKLKESLRQDLFARVVDQEKLDELKEDAREVYFEANLFDLINAFTVALRTKPEKSVYEMVREEYTVEQKIHTILHLLVDHDRVSLTDLFAKSRSKMEIIVIFMAVLELIRLREIIAVQRRMFDDIEIVRNTDNIVTQPTPPSEGPGHGGA